MILYLLNIADLFSTVIALAHGLVEMNPFLNFLMGLHPAVFPAVKVIPAYYLCMWLAKNARRSRAARIRYTVICGIYALIVAWNIVNTAAWVA